MTRPERVSLTYDMALTALDSAIGMLPESESRTLSVWISTLGGQSLSSNAHGAKRHPHAVKEAKDALGEASYYAALAQHGPNCPELTPLVDVLLDYHICYKHRPGDGLLRFRDPSNGGGDVAKVVIDYALTKTGILGDDDRHWVRMFSCCITEVDTNAEEGILLTVREVGV